MDERHVFTVTELNNCVKELVESVPAFGDLLLRGEVSNYKVYPSGHHYFTLKDSESALRCVMFKGSAMKLRFKPENGMQVIASGRISVYPRDGAYQLYCNGLSADGVGDLYVAFEQLKDKLYREGLFDPAHKKPLPRFPQRIAIVTSSAGAAVHDMIRILRRRYPIAKVLLLPVRVQGVEAPPEIVGAIRYANRYKLADVLITGRGGGSLEDLWAFNDERVARAIYLQDADERMAQSLLHSLRRQEDRLAVLEKKRVLTDPTAFLADRRLYLDHVIHRLAAAEKSRVDGESRRFAAAAAALDALSPLKVLARGYAVAQSGDGTVLKSAAEVAAGERIRVRLAQGSLQCDVVDKED